MMNRRRTTALTALLLVTTFIIPSMLFAADTEEEALRRTFVSPENRAEKFRQPEAYFPHRVAMPGDNVLQLPKSRLADDFEVHYAWEGQWRSIDDFNERTGTNALLILKDGKIVKEIYRNGATPESRFISWSTGKSVISTLVGMAIEDGYIDDVNDLLTKYLPELVGSAYDGVTIRDALQMTSGVEWDEETYSFSDLSKPLNRGWEYSIIKHQYRFVEGANELPRANVPGTKFNYSSMDSSILGWLVEKATKQRVTNYLEKRLWQPAGMEFKASWVIDGPEDIGREMGGGMLAASLRDYGRFGLMMSNRGKLNGVQHVSKNGFGLQRPPIARLSATAIFTKAIPWAMAINGGCSKWQVRSPGNLRAIHLCGAERRCRYRQAKLLATALDRATGNRKLCVFQCRD